MKITPAHYVHMRDAIAGLLPHVDSLKAAIAADPRVKDPARRLRWDMLWRAGLSDWVCREIYPYADDSHIETALRRIAHELAL